MKLALKVALVVIAGIVIVLGAFAYLRVQREVELFDSDMRKDHTLIATTLAVSVLDVWTTDGPSRADELVRLADNDRAGVHIGWVPREPGRRSLLPIDWDSLTDVEHRVARLSETSTGLQASDSGSQYLVSYLPVIGSSGSIGALEMANSFEVRNAYIRTSILNSLLATFVMMVVASAVVLILGVWLIGRPLKLLSEKAQRVGAADLSGPLELRQSDEIGILAKEMNAMCERLAAAHAQAEAEALGRLKAVEQLRHADRLITVGKLAAGIAHELGTPLNVVSGRAKMITRGKVQGATVIEYAQSIIEQAERMTAIIRQLLDFSRRREARKARVELSSATASCVELLRHMAKKAGLELVLEPGGEVFVHADPNQLDQATTNLVVNAIHASQGDGKIWIRTGLASEMPSAPSGAEQLGFVQVRDQGLGMSEEVRSRIFEPFYTTKDVGQGSGLGLSVVFGIVEEHGGRIEVVSELGEGSTFTVYLPLDS